MAETMTRKQASALGLSRFWTRKRCRHGHPPERYTSNGGCTGCRKAQYDADPEAARERSREWRHQNPGKQKETYAKWLGDEKNREHKLAYNRERRLRLKDKLAAQGREWYHRNRKQVLEKSKAHYRANKEEFKRRHAERRAADPDRMKRYRKANPDLFKAYELTRRARERNAEGVFSRQSLATIRKLQRNKCAVCRTPLGAKKGDTHADHIIPLSKGGTNWPRNIQLLCPPCNLSKYNSDPIEFMQSKGFLL